MDMRLRNQCLQYVPEEYQGLTKEYKSIISCAISASNPITKANFEKCLLQFSPCN